MHDTLRRAYVRCEEILSEYGTQLDKITQFLLENDTMTREQFEAVMDGRAPGIEA